MAHNFNVLVESHCSHQACLKPQQAAVFSKKALKTHSAVPVEHKTAYRQVSNLLLNILEHLEAKEQDILLWSWLVWSWQKDHNRIYEI